MYVACVSVTSGYREHAGGRLLGKIREERRTGKVWEGGRGNGKEGKKKRRGRGKGATKLDLEQNFVSLPLQVP